MTESDSIAEKTESTTANDDAASDLAKKSTAEQTSASAEEIEDAVALEPKAAAVKAGEEALVSDEAASDGEEGTGKADGEDGGEAAEAKEEKPKPVPAEPPPRAESSFGNPGQEQKIVHFDTDESRASCRQNFEDNPYAWPEGIKAPEIVMDIGAYVGASAIQFARRFPSATVHAYEPNTAARTLLKENVTAYPNIKVHEEAIWDRDEDRKLFDGKNDPLTASLVPSTANVASGEEVRAQHADEALDNLNLSRSDVVKINTGGSEVAILQAMIRHMEATPVIFITYRSETDRRRIDLILCATHMLLGGTIEGPHRGQLCYGLRRILDAKAVGEKDAVRLHRTPFK